MNFRRWCKVDKNIHFGIKGNGLRLLTNIKMLYKGKTLSFEQHFHDKGRAAK